MTALAGLKTLALTLLQDEAGHISSDDQDQAFREALVVYERDVPRTVIEDLDGDGSAYQFSLSGTTFSPRFSQVLSVEYPTGERPQCYLERSDYRIYQSATDTYKLDLPNHTPNSGETVRVNYTARHTIESLDAAAATTVPTWDEHALVTLAASKMLTRLANRFVNEQESTLYNADGIARLTKSGEASRRAKELLDAYHAMIGSTGDDGAAGIAGGTVVIDWDPRTSTGLFPLTHHGREW